ncbi:hypothetical protein K474DRAFT_1679393 [Panus rudis PR-1116 ss-1]|nr:hypothetical protein K474DRAFT_1679393 [Panus rudis PR-1116 ss-1]
MPTNVLIRVKARAVESQRNANASGDYAYSLAIVAFVALVLYDCLLTLNKEIACIWRRKIAFPSVLCLLNRYLLLCAATFAGLELLPWSSTSAKVKSNRTNVFSSSVSVILTDILYSSVLKRHETSPQTRGRGTNTAYMGQCNQVFLG